MIDALLSAGWRVLAGWVCATRSTEVRKVLAELLRRWIDGAEVSGQLCSDSTHP